MYLEKRRRLWYAFQDIPKAAQKAVGKRRFCIGLDTEDRQQALRRAQAVQLKIQAEIAHALHGTKPNQFTEDALWLRNALREASDETERLAIRDHIADLASDMADKAAQRAGVKHYADADYEDVPGVIEANRFFDIATGKLVELTENLEQYLDTAQITPKTASMRREAIQRFAKRFTHAADVTRKGVQEWINELAKGGAKGATIQRMVSDLRGYWRYLRSLQIVPDDVEPFANLSIPKAQKGAFAKKDERKPFSASDVVALLAAARERKDEQLANLIELAMWSGARREELCSLKLENVDRSSFHIVNAKTNAGWREVPIHSKLKPTIKRLRDSSTDGYLLSGLERNKFGDRGDAIGKRFGHLKQAKGFGSQYVFHSIRKTVATLLKDAGVPEPISADIMGHKIPTMTYGLYAGGASLATKREAIEKLRY